MEEEEAEADDKGGGWSAFVTRFISRESLLPPCCRIYLEGFCK